jgi:uncharacterized repeat protein (TIGR02543 family)
VLPVDVELRGYTFDGWYEGQTKVTRITETDLGDKVYTAKWIANTYKITYHNMEGAVNHPSNAGQYTFDIGLTLGEPTKTGHDFDGWYRDAGFSNPITAISADETGDIDVYAKWTPKVYNVVLNINGGTLAPESNITSYTYGSAVPLPTSDKISKTGYAFGGWSDGTNIVTEIAQYSTGDKSYTAVWSLVTYSINYVLDGGTNSSDNPGSYSIISGNIYLTAPTKPGHIFLGWYRDSNFTTPTGSPAIPAGSTGPVTFYARWRPIRYTVQFHANLGTGSMDPQEFNVGEKKKLRKNTFSRNGYNFDGWATNPDGSKVYNDEHEVLNLTQTDGGVVHLYAVWTIVTYTITYHLNGGTNDPSNPATYTVETQGIMLKNPTRAGGYVFDGWCTNSKFTGDKVTQIAAGSTGNLVLYASWKHYGVFNVSAGTGSQFVITRTGGSDGTQKVYYRTQNGSAIGGTHFTYVDSYVVFNQGETSKTITISENSVTSAYGRKVATKYSNIFI